jgi:NAD(P)-dependent dehydrogenase (short-subunit alcohol dehydrogenase family)
VTARHPSFHGRTVLVTGAAGGLGRALALEFAANGARIVALDRDEAGLDSLRAELEGRGAACLAAACDVTDAEACERAVVAGVERFGGLDVLVNNAGMSHRSAFERTDLAVIRRVMEVNFFGAVNCTKAALPALLAARGLVIAISSVAGYTPLIARTGYAASKHAMHGFFESLRTELAPRGVAVTMVCPSFIATQIDRNALGGDGRPVRHAQITVGRPLTADAAAQQIVAGAARGRRLLLVGRTAWLAWWVSRLAPAVYDRLMARRLRGELESGTNTARTTERKPRP